MHVVRNVLPLRTVLSTHLYRGISAAASLATDSVIPLKAVPQHYVTGGTATESSIPDSAPSMPKGQKKRPKKKSKTNAGLMEKSGDATSRRREIVNDLMRTLQSTGQPVKPETPAPAEKPANSKKKQNKRKPASLSKGPVVDGWKGEDWGSDELRPREEQFAEDLPNDKKSSPPHIRPPITYIRRLEGLLAPLDQPILQDVQPMSQHRPIAKLDHKLDRVLFNPGVHWLQDPRTGVYNFTPWLENIPDVRNFAFDRLPGFVKSSRDEDLWALAKREDRVFSGSTSSLTGMLSHIYFLISGDRDVDVSSLSRHFQTQPVNFTPGQRMPASVLLNHKDGVYAIDSLQDNDDPEKNVLTWMGTLLEKLLTMPPEKFSRLLRDSTNPAEPDTDPRREAYRYAKSKKFVMRSQLDCHDSRLPGTGVFDIKTRAALPIRLDMLNYEEHAGYLIRTLQGPLESFEKEYYDLIRSAFLKYSFQARIGNMDGILVAHHNASRIFGFQYITLAEMDTRLYGDASRGERVFEKCVLLLEEVLMEAIACFPNQSVQCLVETRERKGLMRVWIEPEVHDEKVNGPRPIVQLDVESVSYLGGEEVRGTTAVSGHRPWSLHWSISRSSSSDEEKRLKKRGAEDRKFRAWSLPTGVNMEDMVKLWNQIDYGGTRLSGGKDTPPTEHTFDPAYFRPASQNIEMLRQLSREGMELVDQRKRQERGKPKVILHHPDQTDREAKLSGETSFSSLGDLCSVRSGSLDTNSSSADPVKEITESSEREDTTDIGNTPIVNTIHWSDTSAHLPIIPYDTSSLLKESSASVKLGDLTVKTPVPPGIVPGPRIILGNGHEADSNGAEVKRE